MSYVTASIRPTAEEEKSVKTAASHIGRTASSEGKVLSRRARQTADTLTILQSVSSPTKLPTNRYSVGYMPTISPPSTEKQKGKHVQIIADVARHRTNFTPKIPDPARPLLTTKGETHSIALRTYLQPHLVVLTRYRVQDLVRWRGDAKRIGAWLG